jgi:TonB family protein
MPNSHLVKPPKISFDNFTAEGKVYTATSEGVDLKAWSLINESYTGSGASDDSAYLDACADLVWESLLKPLRDALPKEPEVVAQMAYRRELISEGLPPGREYSITLGDRMGMTHFYVAGPQIYVLIALNANANFATTQRFINSFGIKSKPLPMAVTIGADPVLVPPQTAHLPVPGVRIRPGEGARGIGPGRGGNMDGGDRVIAGGGPATEAGNTDYKRIFSGREVTQKARVISKPEPQYTDAARKFAVTGTVVLRAVFTGSGDVNNIKVVKGLPHGLTERAVGAAREIKFSPAQKDGHDVSMFIQLEYNFNLY